MKCSHCGRHVVLIFVASDQDATTSKKKTRRKHKDLPSLGGYNGVMVKSKSKPIPNR